VDGEVKALWVVLIAVGLTLPGLASGSSAASTKKRCHVVVKRIHGKKKRVRVCAKPKTKPKPHAVRRVDVGGYKLAIECRGTGKPTVLFDSGFNTSRGAWSAVQRRMMVAMRVCTYDRAGIGQSDARPDGVAPTTARIVDELHTLLVRAHEPPPYVLGGWSIGGFDVRYYTKRYPDEVAGLLLVDAPPPSFLPNELSADFETMIVGDAARELEPAPSLGARPLVVLTHGIPIEDEARWLAEQKRVARSSSSSMLVRADETGHDIPQAKPGLVGLALKVLVGAVRRAESFPGCAAVQGLPSYGGTCLDPGAP
jgi:pimeloyl-ACP methyl ester carboxylesterase